MAWHLGALEMHENDKYIHIATNKHLKVIRSYYKTTHVTIKQSLHSILSSSSLYISSDCVGDRLHSEENTNP